MQGPSSNKTAIGGSEVLKQPAPDFTVDLIRSVQTLAALPPLREVFSGHLPSEPLKVSDARVFPVSTYGDFTAMPVFLTAGYRNVAAPVFNEKYENLLRRRFGNRDGASGLSALSIGEACRNIGQHGGQNENGLRYGLAQFAPGAVFVKTLVYTDPGRKKHAALLCMVADEGRGISDPSRSLVDGVGGSGGEDYIGMGNELASSLIEVIKSRDGRWFLYDGLHHTRGSLGECVGRAGNRRASREGVKPLAELNLPAGVQGCKKIFLFAQAKADKQSVFRQAVDALTMSAV